MDTSKTYIKMCSTDEVQLLWEPKEGDWFFCRGRNQNGELATMVLSSNCIASNHDTIYIPMLSDLHATYLLSDEIPKHIPVSIQKQTYTRFPLRYFIWLPRTDQLQEMSMDTDAITTEMKFHGWIITSNYIPIGLTQPSMEQLWLAFVMLELHHKKWDGKEWN